MRNLIFMLGIALGLAVPAAKADIISQFTLSPTDLLAGDVTNRSLNVSGGFLQIGTTSGVPIDDLIIVLEIAPMGTLSALNDYRITFDVSESRGSGFVDQDSIIGLSDGSFVVSGMNQDLLAGPGSLEANTNTLGTQALENRSRILGGVFGSENLTSYRYVFDLLADDDLFSAYDTQGASPAVIGENISVGPGFDRDSSFDLIIAGNENDESYAIGPITVTIEQLTDNMPPPFVVPAPTGLGLLFVALAASRPRVR